ncbi:MAG: winged helix-turn-helix transcriptional regulator [Deltaproteobacteria bacterium]|nr:winged helix-turn-helix transcriptional regulator [Nannocystaceae bacterium]
MVELFDSPLLRALAEPARLDVVRVLLVEGSSDIAGIAERLPQDRSVISRHLKTLLDAGVVRSHRDGRRVIYAIDGGRFIGALEAIVAEAKALAPLCCPPAIIPRAERAGRR